MENRQVIHYSWSFEKQINALLKSRFMSSVRPPETVHLSIPSFKKGIAELYFRDGCNICCGEIEACSRINDKIVEEYIRKTDKKTYKLLELLPKENVETLTPRAKIELNKTYELENALESHIDLDKVKIFLDPSSNRYVFDTDQEEFFTIIGKVGSDITNRII